MPNSKAVQLIMLSYQHAFHAGNPADVLKHSIQSLIIDALKQKEKALLFLDTHSGSGRYFLKGAAAEKTKEYRQGIGRIWKLPDTSRLLAPYLRAVSACNQAEKLLYYPGSGLIAQSLFRPQDRLYLVERHPREVEQLAKLMHNDSRIHVMDGDGLQQVKALLPPRSRRGFIFIDPAYEREEEYEAVIAGVREGYKRFASGVYAIWYPVVFRRIVEKFERKLYKTGIPNILQVELSLRADSSETGMTGSGLFIINPPWKLPARIATLLPELYRYLCPQTLGKYRIQWLAPPAKSEQTSTLIL